MSPALALAYLFWTRHRRGLSLLGGLWLVVMIYCRAVPAGAFTLAPDGSVPPALMAFVFLCSCLIAAVGYLVLVFTFGREARLEACESGFPARLRTLPLPARALAGWPMLWGSATMMLGWLTLAWAARRPCSLDVPLVWPGLLLAAVVAWLQAILWTPLPLPWVRAFLFIPASYVLVFAPLTMLVHGAPADTVSGLLIALLSAAYLTAIRGVARARRGDTVQWGWPAWLRWPQAVRTRPPFRSAARAQLWFEWRLHGRVFPVAVALFAIFMLPMIPVYAKMLDEGARMDQPIVPPSLLQELGSLWLVVVGSLVLAPFVAGMSGLQMGKLGRKSYRLSSFLATRPVSEAMLVRVKFEAAAWSTLAGWGVLAAGLLLWFALGGQAAVMAEQFEMMRQRHAPALFWGWLVLLIGGAIVLPWLQMVQRMWIGLTGNRRVIDRMGYGLLAFSGLIYFGYWLGHHPEHWPAFNRLLPWLAGAAVVLKCLAAVWSLRALRRRALIPPRVLWGALGIWLGLAAGAFAALYVLLPAEWFSVPGAVLGIVLLLPLTRLALAPLVLAWNRHR